MSEEKKIGSPDELLRAIALTPYGMECLRAMDGIAEPKAFMEAVKELEEIRKRYESGEVSLKCNDPHHDIRWCSTCSYMESGVDSVLIEMDRVLSKLRAAREGK